MKKIILWGVVFMVLVLLTLPLSGQAMTLYITSIPPGAQVWINGVNSGKITPTSIYAMDMNMGGQSLKVKLVIPGSTYEPYETKLLPDRESAELKVDFAAKHDQTKKSEFGSKLETLNDLLRRGLITQEEYNKKKADLLEKF